MSTEEKRAVWRYLMQTVQAIDAEFSPAGWDADIDPVHAVIHLDRIRAATWVPDFGWRVQAAHPATGTPDGKALYLDAGPFPPADVVADRLTVWSRGRLTLTAAQPCYPFSREDLLPALEAATSGRPVQVRCPHCGEWETAGDEGEENAYCGSCGTHMPLREVEARAASALDGTEAP